MASSSIQRKVSKFIQKMNEYRFNQVFAESSPIAGKLSFILVNNNQWLLLSLYIRERHQKFRYRMRNTKGIFRPVHHTVQI